MKLLIFVALAAAFTVGCSKSDNTDASAPPKSDAVTTTTGAVSSPTKAPEKESTGGTASDKFAAIQPILTKNCMPCHATGRPKAGIDLTSYESVMKGGREGAIIMPGDVAGSKLDMALHGTGVKPMPPKGPLSTPDLDKIESWIKSGAKNT